MKPLFLLLCVAALFACVATPHPAIEFLQDSLRDGVLTQLELERLQVLLNAPTSGWKDAAYTALTIGGAILGVRLTPNRFLLGKLTETLNHGNRQTDELPLPRPRSRRADDQPGPGASGRPQGGSRHEE